MASRWTLGILSTDYDLHDYREALINRLKTSNVRVSAFELPDFPVEPEKHSHQSCITALKRTNIAILIIDKRYGGIFYDSAKTSITMKEYLTAAKHHIPCLAFVNSKAWDERHYYNIDKNASRQHAKNFDKKYQCKYVDSVDTLHFIDELCHAYDNWGCSNWITLFDGIPDLLEKVEEKLKGLSRFWLEKLVYAQKENILARKTSTCFSMSLGDVFHKGYYIDPEYVQESGELTESDTNLEKAIVSSLLASKSILIYGEAGYGKTTILAKSFLEHVDRLKLEGSYKLPFYIWLKGKNIDYHFDFAHYIEDSFIENLNFEPYPFLDITDIRPIFYLDGFDELAEEMLPPDVSRISNSSIFSFPLMLTSRIQYAHRYLSNYELMNLFSVRIRINKWGIEKAKGYIDNFCSKRGSDKSFAEKIYGLLTDNSDLCDLLDNPLLITMLLWVIESNRMTVPETISTRVQLFQAFLYEMAKREIHRTGSNLKEDDLVLIWAYFAWLSYREKIFGRQAKINEIFRMLQKKLLPEYQVIYHENMFDALFDIANKKVFGTFHEQFLEFLVANTFYHASLYKRDPYPEFLRYVVRPEINRYFRAIWNESSEDEREVIVANIYEQYIYNIGSNDNKSVAIRVHAIYHVSRLPSALQEEILEKAFRKEDHISVRLSLFLVQLRMGC